MISGWIDITQDLVNRFAEVTGDRQWIHTDPTRGDTIAHGFLTLSLFSTLLAGARTSGPQSADLRSDDRGGSPDEDARRLRTGGPRSINYGLDRVRFIAPVKVGSRIRGRFERAASEERDDGTRVVWHVTIESDASEKPCCVADWIVLYVR
jgi:acyl dehydratase